MSFILLPCVSCLPLCLWLFWKLFTASSMCLSVCLRERQSGLIWKNLENVFEMRWICMWLLRKWKKLIPIFSYQQLRMKFSAFCHEKFFFVVRNKICPKLTWNFHRSFFNFVECKFIWILFVKFYVADGHSEL